MKRLLILCACAILLLCGCSWHSVRYASVTPHEIGYLQTDDEPLVVSSYFQLRNALTDLVDLGAEKARIVLVDYPTEQALADMERAVGYVREVYPIGAYALEDIQYEHGVGSQEALSVELHYRRSKAEIDSIYNVRGIAGATEAITEALRNFQPSLVLQITGFQETDFVQIIEDWSQLHPEIVMEPPQVTATICPQRGSVRILSLDLHYQTSRDSLRYMREKVEPIFSSARLYVNPDASDEEKFSQLSSFLMQRMDYTLRTSLTPCYSLLCYGVGDSEAFAQVYAAMCRQVGLEAKTVTGTCNGESRVWNMVRCDQTYYHVDLLRTRERGRFELLTDPDMEAYVWDYLAYPRCGAPISEQTEPVSRPSAERIEKNKN